MVDLGSQFYLALGDFSYQLGGEKNWRSTLITINGEFGHSLYAVNTEDAEAGYFAKLDSTTFGIMKYAVSSTELKTQYIASNAGDFADSFTITDATVSR